jgi:hypothetical protein
MRLLVRWFASLLLAGAWAVPFALAQGTSPSDTTAERPPQTIPYAFALVSTILVLLIVCIPTRKQPP